MGNQNMSDHIVTTPEDGGEGQEKVRHRDTGKGNLFHRSPLSGTGFAQKSEMSYAAKIPSL